MTSIPLNVAVYLFNRNKRDKPNGQGNIYSQVAYKSIALVL